MRNLHPHYAFRAAAVLLCLGLAAHPALADSTPAPSKAKLPASPPVPVVPRKGSAPAVPPKVTAPARAPLGAAPGQALNRRAVDAHAARGMRELKEIGPALRNLPGQQTGDPSKPGGVDLTGRRNRGRFPSVPSGQQGSTGNARMPAGMPPMPALPSNSAKRPRSVVGSPSHNLRDHMGGSSGSVEIGEPTTEAGGSSVRIGEVRTEVAPSSNVEIGEVQTEVAPSGGGSVKIGDVQTEVAKEPKESFKDDIVKMQDPSANAATGGCNPVTGQCSGAPAQDPNRTNPGAERPGTQPTATRLQIDRKGLVTNPAAPRGFASGDVPRRPENNGARVNPPNPNDVPP